METYLELLARRKALDIELERAKRTDSEVELRPEVRITGPFPAAVAPVYDGVYRVKLKDRSERDASFEGGKWPADAGAVVSWRGVRLKLTPGQEEGLLFAVHEGRFAADKVSGCEAALWLARHAVLRAEAAGTERQAAHQRRDAYGWYEVARGLGVEFEVAPGVEHCMVASTADRQARDRVAGRMSEVERDRVASVAAGIVQGHGGRFLFD